MAFKLTSAQSAELLAARPDIAADKGYSKDTNAWWKKYGTKEYGDWNGFLAKKGTAATATPSLTIAQQVQATPQPTYTPSALVQQGQAAYTWDPNQYLPEINKQAEAIYGPQKAQLEAMRGLVESQAKQTEEKTYRDYQKRMQEEVDAINNRGAYFGGGAINAESDIRTQRDYELQQQQFQSQSTLLENLTQQGLLSAQQAEYVKTQLQGAEGSAYQRYRDKVADFQFNSTQDYDRYRDQVGDFQANRDFTFKVLTDERDYGWDVNKFMLNYNLDVESLKLQQSKFKSDVAQLGVDNALKRANLDLEASKNKGSASSDYYNDISSYTDKVLKGQMSRENARDLLNSKYGSGSGQAIYDIVKDGQAGSYATSSSRGA